MAALKPHQAQPLDAYQPETRAPGSFEFKCIRHLSPSLDHMRDLWASMPGGATGTPFQTPAFLDAFQRNMLSSGNGHLEIHELRKGQSGETAMLLPIHVYKRGPLRVASLPDLGLADQGGPVIARGFDLNDAETDAIWESFTDALTDVDVLTIKNIVPILGPQLNPLYRLPIAQEDQPMLMLAMAPEGEQEVWRRRPVFKEIRQKERKLVAAGVRFEEAQTPEARLEVLSMIRNQRSLRFEAMGRTNSLEFPGRINFYEDIAKLSATEKNAVFLALRTDTEITAAVMAFTTRDMINGVLIAMGDEKWHRMSPGVVLFALTMDWAKANGIRQFSFGTGMQGYKQRFGPQEVPLKRIQLPLTRIGKSVLKLHQIKQTLQNYLRKENEA